MYTFTPQEIRLIHEERISRLIHQHDAPKRKTDRKPRKWEFKWFKSNEA